MNQTLLYFACLCDKNRCRTISQHPPPAPLEGYLSLPCYTCICLAVIALCFKTKKTHVGLRSIKQTIGLYQVPLSDTLLRTIVHLH